MTHFAWFLRVEVRKGAVLNFPVRELLWRLALMIRECEVNKINKILNDSQEDIERMDATLQKNVPSFWFVNPGFAQRQWVSDLI